MNQLSELSISILSQIKQLVYNVSDEDYSKPLELLSGNTIAKHVRHILEISDEMLKGFKLGTINYDARQRNLLIEHNREFTVQFIDELILKLKEVSIDFGIELKTCFDLVNNQTINVQTSIHREMVYNIEHAIHHMAIIQIVVKNQLSYIPLPPNFGVAISTIKYNTDNVHANLRS